MVDLSVELAGVVLKNPIIPASGTFGYGREFAECYDLDILGSFSWKGTTAAPRAGNPQPRIAETASGMLNAVGLQNPGMDAVLREEVPWIGSHFHGPVIANVCGFSLEEYAENCRMLEDAEQVKILEVNISCPNVHAGGKNFGSDPQSAAAVTRAVRAATKKPVFMKLSPNVTDIVEIARACEAEGADGLCLINTLLGMRIDLRTKKPVFMKLSPNVTDIVEIARACEAEGADGLCLINTLLGMRIDLRTRRPILANRTGGLSGPAVFPVALRMVWDVYEAVKLPIIGCGGVDSAEAAAEMMLAGAGAVEVGAANLRDPWACPKIIEALPAVCARLGVSKISDLTGGAHHG